MTTNLTPPEGYFDATKLLILRDPPKTVKVSHFLDNEYVFDIPITLGEYKISKRGHYGYTWLKDELKPAYLQWLDNIGSRIANKSEQSNYPSEQEFK
mgnify:CR=1 FL=1